MKYVKINYNELTAGKIREILKDVPDHRHLSIGMVDNRGDIYITESKHLDRHYKVWNDQSKVDKAMFHDVVLDATDLDLEINELLTVFHSFPENLVGMVDEWGFCDTVVRENIHEYLSRQKVLDELSAQAQELGMYE